MILSTEQAGATTLLDQWHDGPKTHCLLTGAAGTGKSVTVLSWLQALMQRKRCRVAIVAPTNRAVRRMRRATEVSLTGVSYMTVHSLLGCREVITPEGLITFKPQFNDYPKTQEVDLIVIDEASMCGQELYEMLVRHLTSQHKVLWVGDLRQLKPVRDEWSPVFSDDFGAARVHLKQVVRQAEGSPILAAADAVTKPHQLRSVKTEGGQLTIEKSMDRFIGLVRELASDDLQAFRLLAWRNVKVDDFNAVIREQLLGKDLPHVVAGDRLVARAPCMEDQNVLLLNSDEVIVQTATYKKDQLLDDLSLDMYEVAGLTEEGTRVMLRVIDPGSKPLYNSLLSGLRDQARAKQLKGTPSKIAWADFFAFKERYHDVSHAWAMTIHRSQGGTFKSVGLLGSDVMFARELDERGRLWYTGATRASEHLIIHL